MFKSMNQKEVEINMGKNALGTLNHLFPPIAVGGLGGSGTRLITMMLQKIGYFMGSDLNESLDNLWFTLLFKRLETYPDNALFLQCLSMFIKLMHQQRLMEHEHRLLQQWSLLPCAEFNRTWAKERVQQMQKSQHQASLHGGHWGWKEPNTHLYAEKLLQHCPNMKYIHVMRHGLDMALSNNQQQLKLWGSDLWRNQPEKPIAELSLRFWVLTHKRIEALAAAHPKRVYLLNYDALCQSPKEGVSQLETFLQLHLSLQCKETLYAMPQPSSVGRYKQTDWRNYDPNDLEYVHKLGFPL